MLTSTIRDIDAMLTDLKDFSLQFSSTETGRHLMENEDLIHKHAIANSQVLGQKETLNKLEKQAKKILAGSLVLCYFFLNMILNRILLFESIFLR